MEPTWVEAFSNLGSAALGGVIGVAWQSWISNRKEREVRHFNERKSLYFEIFESIQEYRKHAIVISKTGIVGTTSSQAHSDFMRLMPKVEVVAGDVTLNAFRSLVDKKTSLADFDGAFKNFKDKVRSELGFDDAY